MSQQAPQPDVFQLPRIHAQHQQLQLAIAAHSRQGNYAEMEKSCRKAIKLVSWKANDHYNLACALAADEYNTAALVDLDLCLGDADVFLDTIPDYTLMDVSQNVTRLDFALLKRSLTKHASGLSLTGQRG